jgi:hypothetical protein
MNYKLKGVELYVEVKEIKGNQAHILIGGKVGDQKIGPWFDVIMADGEAMETRGLNLELELVCAPPKQAGEWNE